MFNYFLPLVTWSYLYPFSLESILISVRLKATISAQLHYQVSTSVHWNLWVTFVSTLVIWNAARATAPAELNKVLTNSQVLEEGSFILESQGRLNKLIKKYGWQRAVFKGNGFELNEWLHIRKHSWGHKHTEALWQSWCDCCITFAIQVRVRSCVRVLVWAKEKECVSVLWWSPP